MSRGFLLTWFSANERAALEGRIEKTAKAIEKARKLLLEFWEKERALGEDWLRGLVE